MKQAKVLTDAEMKRLLAVIANSRHAERNRLAVMLSHLAGLRVGEIAALIVGDTVNRDGKVRDQVRLNPAFTKGGVGRTIFVKSLCGGGGESIWGECPLWVISGCLR